MSAERKQELQDALHSVKVARLAIVIAVRHRHTLAGVKTGFSEPTLYERVLRVEADLESLTSAIERELAK